MKHQITPTAEMLHSWSIQGSPAETVFGRQNDCLFAIDNSNGREYKLFTKSEPPSRLGNS
jgi:hypothetical protein